MVIQSLVYLQAIYIFATLGGITIMRIGDMNTAALITEANNPDQTIPPPIVTLSRPPGGETFLAGQNRSLTATVTSLDYIREVVFFDNGTIVGADRRQNSGKLKMQVGSFGLLLYNHN